MALNDEMVESDLQRMQREVAIAYFKVLSQPSAWKD
jgi:hypothetical protein